MSARLAFLLIVAFFSGAALAQKAPVYSDAAGAIRGYDPVAYFTEGRPVKGSREFSHRWNGAEWRGGYCAYGVAGGYAVKIEPEAWSVVDGKLKADANWPAVVLAK